MLTRYNNKTYRVDDIIFDQNPSSVFAHHHYGDIAYVDYYKKQYDITVRDLKQPLLLSRKSLRISGEPEKREVCFLMLPELCCLTGLEDKMRKNYTVMKDLATFTKLSPYQRVLSYKKYIDNVNNTPEAKAVLSQWGLAIDSDPTKVTARLIDEQRIIFGNDKEFKVGPQADFSRNGKTSSAFFEPVRSLLISFQPLAIASWIRLICSTGCWSSGARTRASHSPLKKWFSKSVDRQV